MSQQPSPKPPRLEPTIFSPDSQLRDLGGFVAGLRRDVRLTLELGHRLFLRDFLAQYRQSILGVFWAFAPPLVTALTFLFLEQQEIINVGETTVPYILYVTSGTVLWQTFIEALNSPLKAVGANRAILTKVKFPREALLLAGIYQLLATFGFRIIILLFAFIAAGTAPTLSILLFPFGMAGLILFGYALGLIVTPLGLLFGDIERIIMMVGGFWMLLTPVVYPPPTDGFGAILSRINPASPMIVTARDWLVGIESGMALQFGAISAVSLVILSAGWIVYRLALPHIIVRMGS